MHSFYHLKQCFLIRKRLNYWYLPYSCLGVRNEVSLSGKVFLVCLLPHACSLCKKLDAREAGQGGETEAGELFSARAVANQWPDFALSSPQLGNVIPMRP